MLGMRDSTLGGLRMCAAVSQQVWRLGGKHNNPTTSARDQCGSPADGANLRWPAHSEAQVEHLATEQGRKKEDSIVAPLSLRKRGVFEGLRKCFRKIELEKRIWCD